MAFTFLGRPAAPRKRSPSRSDGAGACGEAGREGIALRIGPLTRHVEPCLQSGSPGSRSRPSPVSISRSHERSTPRGFVRPIVSPFDCTFGPGRRDRTSRAPRRPPRSTPSIPGGTRPFHPSPPGSYDPAPSGEAVQAGPDFLPPGEKSSAGRDADAAGRAAASSTAGPVGDHPEAVRIMRRTGAAPPPPFAGLAGSPPRASRAGARRPRPAPAKTLRVQRRDTLRDTVLSPAQRVSHRHLDFRAIFTPVGTRMPASSSREARAPGTGPRQPGPSRASTRPPTTSPGCTAGTSRASRTASRPAACATRSSSTRARSSTAATATAPAGTGHRAHLRRPGRRGPDPGLRHRPGPASPPPDRGPAGGDGGPADPPVRGPSGENCSNSGSFAGGSGEAVRGQPRDRPGRQEGTGAPPARSGITPRPIGSRGGPGPHRPQRPRVLRGHRLGPSVREHAVARPGQNL